MPNPVLSRAMPRPGGGFGSTDEAAARFTQMRLADPSFEAPPGYEWKGDHYERDTHGLGQDLVKWGSRGAMAATIGLGTMGAAGIGPLAAGGGGGGAAATTTGAVAAGTPAATTGLGGLTLPGAVGAGGGAGSMAVPSWLQRTGSILNRLSPVLGGAADGRAAQTTSANNALRDFDRTRLDRANSMDRSILDRAQLDIDQRKFKLDAPGKRMTSSARGSLMANAQPTSVSSGAPMTMSSGASVRPTMFSSPVSALNQNSRDLGSMVTQQMLDDQSGGDQFAPLPAVDFPEPTPPSDGGLMQDVLDIGGLAAGVGGAIQSPTMDRLLARYRSGGGS